MIFLKKKPKKIKKFGQPTGHTPDRPSGLSQFRTPRRFLRERKKKRRPQSGTENPGSRQRRAAPAPRRLGASPVAGLAPSSKLTSSTARARPCRRLTKPPDHGTPSNLRRHRFPSPPPLLLVAGEDDSPEPEKLPAAASTRREADSAGAGACWSGDGGAGKLSGPSQRCSRRALPRVHDRYEGLGATDDRAVRRRNVEALYQPIIAGSFCSTLGL